MNPNQAFPDDFLSALEQINNLAQLMTDPSSQLNPNYQPQQTVIPPTQSGAGETRDNGQQNPTSRQPPSQQPSPQQPSPQQPSSSRAHQEGRVVYKNINYVRHQPYHRKSKAVLLRRGVPVDVPEPSIPSVSVSVDQPSTSNQPSQEPVPSPDNQISNANENDQFALLFDVESLTTTQIRASRRAGREVLENRYRVTHNLYHANSFGHLCSEIESIFRRMIQPLLDECFDNDYISVYVTTDGGIDCYLGYVLKPNFQFHKFYDLLHKMSQSKKRTFFKNGTFYVNVSRCSSISSLRAGSRSKRFRSLPTTAENYIKRKFKTVIEIKNPKNCPNSCVYFGVALGFAYNDEQVRRDEYEWRRYRKNIRDPKVSPFGLLQKGAMMICEGANVVFDTVCNTQTLDKLQAFLDDHQIYMFERPNSFESPVTINILYKGPPNKKKICLEYVRDEGEGEAHSGHVNFVTSMKSYCDTDSYCFYCDVGCGYWHKCAATCDSCRSYPPCDQSLDLINCEECLGTFFGETCYENHTANHFCKKQLKCKRCRQPNEGKNHKCFEHYCWKCDEHYVEQPHYHYIRTKDLGKLQDEDMKNKFIVCFDIESTQDRKGTGVDKHKYFHSPNLLYARVTCDECWDEGNKCKRIVKNLNGDLDDYCLTCGDGEISFNGFDCVSKFVEWLLGDPDIPKDDDNDDSICAIAKREKASVHVYAHNLKGYDGHFLLRELVKMKYLINPVMTGNKIMKIDVGNCRITDSLNLFQTSLAELPKMFGFTDSVKGFFPHELNTRENWKVFDNVPDKKFFSPDDMSVKKKAEFEEWWESMNGKPYDFEFEIRKYCSNDVKILMTAIQEYRRQFKQITEIDPTTRNFTLASVAMETFQTTCLKEKTIGITPNRGYENMRKRSIAGEVWLKYMEQEFGPIMREQKVGSFWCDGVIREQKIAFEYLGCHWHAHDHLYGDLDHVVARVGLTVGQIRQRDEAKMAALDQLGYTVIKTWECQFRDLKNETKEMSRWYGEKYEESRKEIYSKPINIRDAFAGGRTNNIHFDVECPEGWSLGYKDFISMYPGVLCHEKYPVGHPRRILRDFDMSLESYDGFVRCRLRPPPRLRIPLLWKKHGGKLYHHLCDDCVENQNKGYCKCPDRFLYGTWPTPELKLAIKLGYKVLSIEEVLHYDTMAGDMFVGYIRKFLKVKQEASGWPKDNMTQEEKDTYIREFKEREGVELDVSKIEKNSGRRSIAKLMLNSLWGKLCQSPNLEKCKIVHTHEALLKMIEDDRYTITGEVDLGDGSLQLTYKWCDDAMAPSGNTSIAIGAFVTSYGRCKLYSVIHELETRSPGSVCYFDTDSVFYKQRDDDPPLSQMGSYLGDLTDEIEKDFGPEARCKRAVFGGPKNYAYQVTVPGDIQPAPIIKCKGLSLTSGARNVINFDLMTEFARKYVDPSEPNQEIGIPQFNIRSNRRHKVYTTRSDKVYRIVSEKRWIKNGETRPFGYRKDLSREYYMLPEERHCPVSDDESDSDNDDNDARYDMEWTDDDEPMDIYQ